MVNDVLVLQKNIVVAANYEKIQPHGTELTWAAMGEVRAHPELHTIDMVLRLLQILPDREEGESGRGVWA